MAILEPMPHEYYNINATKAILKKTSQALLFQK